MDFTRHYEQVRERYGNGGMSRRRFLGQVGLMALACGLAGSAMAPLARAAQTLRYDGYGGVSQGAFTKDVLQPFTAKTGIAFNQGSYGLPEELIAKIQADGLSAYNYCNCSDQLTVLRFVRLGYGSALDESKMPRLKDLIPRALDAYRRLGNGKLTAVPFGLSGGWMGYNPGKIELAEIEEKKYGILVDPKYKGQVTGQDSWTQRIWHAALQSGQDPNAIKDMDAVWAKIRESKQVVLKYWHTSAEQMELFSSGSAVVGDAWFIPGFNLKKRGVQFATWPAQGTYIDFGSFMVLKGSPLDPVYEIVDILLRPEVMVALATEVGNVPLLDPNKHPMPPEVQALPGYDPRGTLEGYLTFDPVYWADNADNWTREYRRVIARG